MDKALNISHADADEVLVELRAANIWLQMWEGAPWAYSQEEYVEKKQAAHCLSQMYSALRTLAHMSRAKSEGRW